MASERAKREMATFLRQRQAEQLVYRPAGAAARTVTGLVDRPGRDELTGVASPHFSVSLLNDAGSGVLVPGAPGGINTGGDLIDVAEWPGGASQRRQVAAVESADLDWIVLTVR